MAVTTSAPSSARHKSLMIIVAILLASLTDLAAVGADSSPQSSSEGQPQANLANHQPAAPSLLYHGSLGNHQLGGPSSDESIDVSSSIGVSSNGGDQSKIQLHGHAGHVEDLLANESGEGDGPKMVAVAPPSGHGPANLPHASVVDTDQDLIGAETEPKFSLSKLKRPFSRLPGLDALRFNNRFLNGAANFLASGSHPGAQRVPPSQYGQPGQHQASAFRQPPPPHMRGPGGPGPNFGQGPPQGMRGPGPNFHPHAQGPPQPMYKAINIPPQGQMHMPGPQQQGPNRPAGAPVHINIPPFQGQQQGPHSQEGSPQPTFHVLEEPMTITVPSGGAPGNDQSDIMNSISDFIGSSENGRLNDINDYDSRPSLSSPSNDIWPLSQPELAKIVNLDVKCEKNVMKVSVEFDRPYNGMIFSKGHFSTPQCIHLAAGSGRTHIYFDIRMDSCGTTGNMDPNALIPSGPGSAGNFFENTVIFQYDPFLQEAWDQARKLRCTWHDQYEKSVSFRPFPVDMVDVVRADFAGDNVGCWMQIQVGRGPWASEVAGIVKIGQTMTMVLAIKDEENKFDMLVRNCVAHDGKRAPIQLVDTHGCIVRSKLMSRFTKIKNFGSSASVLSYAHFQAFKFPDSMEVHFQCTIQICKNRCPEQCDTSGNSNVHYVNHQISGTFNTGNGGSIQNHQIQPFGNVDSSLYLDSSASDAGQGAINRGPGESVLARPREIRDVSAQLEDAVPKVPQQNTSALPSKEVGVNKVIRVVSSGDLSFATSDKLTQPETSATELAKTNATTSGSTHLDHAKSWLSERMHEKICMSSLNFVVCFATLAILLLLSCTCSVVLCCRRRSSESECKKKSAKETALTAKMVLGAAGAAAQQQHGRDYHHHQNSSQVISGGNAHAYLGSSSVLSPRVQASGYAHHRSSDLYHS